MSRPPDAVRDLAHRPGLVVERNGDVATVTGIGSQALDLLGELVDERVPPKLPVGDDVQAGALLHGDRLVDRPP